MTIGDAAISRGDIMREIREIKRQLRELAASRRLEAAAIGKGGITIRDGGFITAEHDGRIQVLHQDGSPAVFLGAGQLPGRLGVHVQDDLSTADPNDPQSAGVDIFRARRNATDSLPKQVIVGSVRGAVNLFDVDAANLIFRHRAGVNQTWFEDLSTTAATANAVVDAGQGGKFLRSTSRRDAKVDIGEYAPAPADVLALQPRVFRDRREAAEHPDVKRWYVGLVADEAVERVPELVDLDVNGEPDAIAYDRLAVALLSVVQDQQKRIEALEAHLGVHAKDPPRRGRKPARRPLFSRAPDQPGR